MASRAKKKKLRNEEKERRLNVLKSFYDGCIQTLKQIQEDIKSGKIKPEDFRK